MRTLVALLAALCLPSVLTGCGSPVTQLVVTLESDIAPAAAPCVGVLVSRLGVGDGAVRHFFAIPEDATFPLSFGVTPPDGDARARVQIRVEALSSCTEPGPAQVVPYVTVRTGFLPAQSLRLPLVLSDACGSCAPDESCQALEASCAPIPDLDPATLAPEESSPIVVGGSTNTVIVP